METRAQVAQRLTKLRTRAPKQSYDRLARELDVRYGVQITGQQLGNYHMGRGPEPEAMNIDLVWAIARHRNVSVESISRVVARRLMEREDRQRLLSIGAKRPTSDERYAAGDSNPEPADSLSPVAA